MLRLALILSIALLVTKPTSAQMWNGVDTLYGNEWIDYSLRYFKFKTSKEGMHRIPFSTLNQVFAQAGLSAASVPGSQFKMFHMGKEVPIFVSSNNSFGSGDFIEFEGKINRGELDAFLYKTTSSHINPYKSLFTDSSAFFLTFEPGAHLRLTTTANNLSNLPAAEVSFSHETFVALNNYLGGRTYTSNNLRDANFDLGEGYSSGVAATHNISVPTAHAFSSGTCTGEIRITSVEGTHQLSVDVGTTNLVSSNFNSWRAETYPFSLPSSLLGASATTFTVRGTASAIDQHTVGYIKINYPHDFNFENSSSFLFNVDNTSTRKYFEITNFNAQGPNPILYDLTDGLKIETSIDNGVVKFVLPATTNTGATQRRLLLVSQASITQVLSGQAVTFKDLRNNQGDYIIVSHNRIISQGNAVQDYADYRLTTAFQPIVLDIEDLYNQFAYGTDRHNQTLRNLTAYALKNWNSPRYMFLIGKGIGYTSTRDNNNPNLLIPAFGDPASDNQHTATNTSNVPRIPIGRLSARTDDEVRGYLNKVIGVESQLGLPQTIADKAWMKKVVHLGGGNPGVEGATIKSNLEAMEAIIEGARYGGEVTAFYKNSTDPIQVSQSEYLDSLINGGVSLITFYGHSSPNSFDFNLDSPENYDNTNKHPLILSLGCYTGSIFFSNRGISEDFVLIPEKGSLGFLATSGLANLPTLYSYGAQFYRHLCGNFYGQGVGRIMQETNRTYGLTPSIDLQFTQQLMTYHGDPAIRLNTHAGPDYTTDASSYSVSPSLVDVQLDSFTISVDVTNLGSSLDTAFWIEVIRTLPNGTQVLATPNVRFDAPHFRRNMTIKVPVGGDDAVGLNTFRISLDNIDEVTERPNPAGEANNVLEFPLLIISNDILPVWPEDFSIAGVPPTIKASVANVLSSPKPYVMQIDTTELFNSPLFQQLNIVQRGGVVDWLPNIPWLDSTVYYWRVSTDSVSTTDRFKWKGRSFLHLQGSQSGWNQSHYYQYLKDDYSGMRLPANRQFNFIDDVQSITVEVGDRQSLPYERLTAYLNGGVFTNHSGSCINGQGLYVAVLDSITLEPKWIAARGGSRFGCTPCNGEANGAFFFSTNNSQSRINLMAFLRDSIPNNAFVLIYSVNDYQPSSWTADANIVGFNLFDVLEANGANVIRNTASSGYRPYAFFYKKNNLSYAPQEAIGNAQSDVITPNFDVFGQWIEGKVNSVKIGPASSWSELHWRTFSTDNQPTDIFDMSIIGVDTIGREIVLRDHVQAEDTTLAWVDASVFPHIKLRYNSRDETFRTSRQLRYWRVVYEGLPEAALRPETVYSFYADTLNEAEDLRISLMLQNISNKPMDSMLVSYNILGRPDKSKSIRYRPLPAGDTLMLNYSLNTAGISGAAQIFIEANPNDDQPEQYHFNNIALLPFFIRGDRVNPLLDVTFDGNHLMNGDIISPKPEIMVTLRDENRYLALDDTTSFQMFIIEPGRAARRIYFGSPYVQFFPPTPLDVQNGKNVANIQLNPTFATEGLYTFIVRARDRSGNESGQLSYQVQFKIINKAAISNILNYPNPFTTNTRFSFVVTGTEVPSDLRVQIFNISGKVVREISKEELGPLKIGNNLTEFAWDGTDQYGDKLGNGVYLYRVFAKDANNNNLENHSNGTDKFFENGFGKMYLMR